VARGWESKSVENQIDSAERESSSNPSGNQAEKQAAGRQRSLLELSRANVQRQLDTAQNERYREQLNRALEDLDKRLAELGPKE
jgi:hypothetical protein